MIHRFLKSWISDGRAAGQARERGGRREGRELGWPSTRLEGRLEASAFFRSSSGPSYAIYTKSSSGKVFQLKYRAWPNIGYQVLWIMMENFAFSCLVWVLCSQLFHLKFTQPRGRSLATPFNLGCTLHQDLFNKRPIRRPPFPLRRSIIVLAFVHCVAEAARVDLNFRQLLL